ncbi:MAG: hypothetical protein U1E05_06435, partial [Patescibacteria group bacterium]|nr:hypothetical protein [Patescibacteria group bacterium]
MARTTVHGKLSRLRSAATSVCRPMGMKGHVARRVSWAAVACWLGIAMGPNATEAAMVVGSVFNPLEFTALDAGGGLNLTAGDSLTFNTNTLQITGTIGGAAVSYGVMAASSQGGGVQMAVFTFSSINIGAGAAMNVIGDRGLVVGSQSNFYLGSTIGGLAGQAGVVGSSSPSGGAGGVGAEGGVRGASYASNPPGVTGGDGGNAGMGVAYDGIGYGAGQKAGADQTGGGGGAYGGVGGKAPGSGGAGGVVYGDAALTELYGGSGGGGARHVSDAANAFGGGGGGGALELVAAGTMTINTTLSLTGGDGGGSNGQYVSGGGGGSGGGVILAANQLHFGTIAAVDASGGSGGEASQAARAGGGGGGGRIALYANSLTGTGSVASRMDLTGGAVFGSATAGAIGTLHQTTYGHAAFDSPYVRIDFNDMSAGNVNGQAGGMGFTGTWTTPVNPSQPSYHIAAVAGDLVAPASTNFKLTQSGTAQSLQGIGNDVSVDKTSRTLTTPLTDTVWFSFLMQPTEGGLGGIDLNSGRIIAVGSSFNTYLDGHDTSTGSVFTNYGTTYLVLGRLDIDAGTGGEDHLRLWVNPDVTLGPDGLVTPTHQDLATNWITTGSVDTLRIETYAGSAGGATPRIDLITLSSGPNAYFNVTGVPEPSAML